MGAKRAGIEVEDETDHFLSIVRGTTLKISRSGGEHRTEPGWYYGRGRCEDMIQVLPAEKETQLQELAWLKIEPIINFVCFSYVMLHYYICIYLF